LDTRNKALIVVVLIAAVLFLLCATLAVQFGEKESRIDSLTNQLQDKSGEIDTLTIQVQNLQNEILILKKYIVAVEVDYSMCPYNDTMWHSNITLRLVNTCPIPFTVGWVDIVIINATFTDGSRESMELTSNLTVNAILQPGGATGVLALTEELGYGKEPTSVGAQVIVFVPDINDTLTLTVEFQPPPK